MKQHKISWLNIPGYIPETWNPIIGCSKVSPGCENCYAEKQAHIRSFNAKTSQYKEVVVKSPHDSRYGEWNGTTTLVKSQLAKPSKWAKPRAIFVCSMGDLFHENTSFEDIDQVFKSMHQTPQHIYIILTKRPERMLAYYKWVCQKAGVSLEDLVPSKNDNYWLGVTAENQEQANKRIPMLLDIPAAKRFVSIEPMLGRVDLQNLNEGIGLHYDCLSGQAFSLGETYHGGPQLDWVICGGETGHKARPMHHLWVEAVRDQCKLAHTPFFFKQWGEWISQHDATEDQREKSKGSTTVGSGWFTNTVIKVGRKTAGNLLDGQQHHAWPQLETRN